VGSNSDRVAIQPLSVQNNGAGTRRSRINTDRIRARDPFGLPVYGEPVSVASLFRSQAQRQPGLCAISDRAKQLTYGDLHAESDALARSLARGGISRGAVVGVALPPSIELILVLLALAKAGAGYLPLDRNLPHERLRFMLARAGGEVFITSSEFPAETLPASRGLYIEDLQRDLTKQQNESAGPGTLPPAPAPGPSECAYICFTSGSTGEPKGVAVRHEALLHLVSDVIGRFNISPATRMVLNTSIGFDVSLAEIWMTLCGGGRLVVTGSRAPLVGERLAEFIDAHKISHMTVTPSVLASVPATDLPSLRCIICAGEACPQELADRWALGREFFNVYGPTEATIYATATQCRRGTKVTIGKALNHVRTYVMDDNLAEVPPGEPGELCLGGSGVAAGYIGDKELTGKKFTAVRGRDRPSDWIYRTGDVVKLDPEGNLVFLGRLDNQIKIRGNRVEIEEIEHSIRRIPGIVEAAVCVDDSAGTSELVCFVVMRSNKEVDPNTISARLAAWLPSYMVPARIVPVEFIPLTATGKKDRRSILSAYRHKIARRNEQFCSPRNKVEEELASIWKLVLRADFDIGVYDDFFDLGGDSLKSLILIAEVEKRFGITVPPGFFGRFTAIWRMAVQLADLLWNKDQQAAPAEPRFCSSRIYKQIRDLIADWPGTRTTDERLISSLGSGNPVYDLFFCCQYPTEFQSLFDRLGPNFRVHCMRSGHLVMDYTPDNIELLSSHYLEEIEQIGPTGALLVGGNCQGAIIAHAVAKKLRTARRDVALLVMIEPPDLLPFHGNVAFIYGEHSHFNPFKNQTLTLADYNKVYEDRYSVDFVPGSHGQYFVPPVVEFVVAKMRSRIAQYAPARFATTLLG
jgi:amino acid adenylation domain-containing protein